MTEPIKKQYKRLYPNGKETIYIKFGDNALTSDGILLPISDLISITYGDYLDKIIDCTEKYDFEKSIKENNLVKKDIKDNSFKVEELPIIKESKEQPIKSEQPIEPPKKRKKSKKPINKGKSSIVDLILNVLTVSCSVLSVYFTGTYLMQLQNLFIAYLISFSMLMYGLIASQLTRNSFRSKRYLRAILFLITTIITIGFSMFTSLDVNMNKYYKNHDKIVLETKTEKSNSLKFELLQEELSNNKEQISKLNEDIKFQQTQWVIMWDNELKKNVIVEGRISQLAQDKITENNERIKELQNRNEEINIQLLQLTESGLTDTETKESEKSKTLTDLIGALTKLGGNTIQMLVLIFPSIMIDMINVLSLTVINIRKEKEF